MHDTLALPAEMTIYTVCELRTQWLTWLAGVTDDAAVDGRAVDQVDAAGVQLLVSLSRSFEAKHLSLRVDEPSDALCAACATLGMGTLLGADHAAVAGAST